MVSSKVLKKVSFVFVWKSGYYYLSKTTRTFKYTIGAILKMPSWEKVPFEKL